MRQGQTNAPIRCPKCNRPTRFLERLWSLKTSSYVHIYNASAGNWFGTTERCWTFPTSLAEIGFSESNFVETMHRRRANVCHHRPVRGIYR